MTILADVKALAVEYYLETGKPLVVTGEIAEAEAARLLNLTLADARSPGFDATRERPGGVEKIQIKGRWKREGKNWGRVGSVDIDKPFDTVMLVLMHGAYETFEIWEAPREEIVARLTKPGSRARNERGSMGVSQFKSIATKVWPNDA